jgi:hypothetical protein
MEIVRESKLKDQDILSDSKSIHLNNFISTGIEFIPVSKNIKIAKKVVIIIQLQDTKCAPFTPIFLPKKPDIIDPIKGK